MSERDAEIAKEVTALVAKYGSGFARMALSPDSLLRSDLLFTQERAGSVLQELNQRFGLVGEIELERYFNGFEISVRVPQLSLILKLLYPSLRDRWRTDPPRADFTVSHLIDVTRSGIWRDPPPLVATEPTVRADQSVIAPIFRTIRFLFESVSCVVALVITALISQRILQLVGLALSGQWPQIAVNSLAIVFWGFVMLMFFENTQRCIADRFGQRWDWRRGCLRDPKKIRVGAPND
ncbi:MAG: hypothetical protein ABL932_08590 [Terricaulis sp.]